MFSILVVMGACGKSNGKDMGKSPIMKKYLVDDGVVLKEITARSRQNAAERYTASIRGGAALVAVQEVNEKGEAVGNFDWFPMRG
jgi:hypothetical protein